MEPRWLISYTPGQWIVLAGGTALVAFDPGPQSDDGLIADLWSKVHGGAEMRDLVGGLARIDHARLPQLAVFFLEPAGGAGQGLWALLRGGVRVLSGTGQTLAHGEDVLTWREVRLAALDRFEVDLGGGPGEVLPLVRGGVRAGRLRLGASTPAETDGSAPAPLIVSEALPTPPTPPTPPPPPMPPTPSAESMPPDVPADPTTVPFNPWDQPDDTLPPTVPAPYVASDAEMEDADTELMYLPPPEAPPALARLRAPDGSTVDLDRPVLIGRAPSDVGFENSQPHLLTVLSPSQDISRTHVLVAPEGDVIVVTDLHSTNGTVVVRPGQGGEGEELQSGQAVTVDVGTVLELGDEVAILVDAAP